VAVVQLLLVEGVKTDYKYMIQVVSRFSHISMVPARLMADIVILDYCRK
jgi:hypothetical protein